MHVFRSKINNKRRKDLVNVIILLIFMLVLTISIGYSSLYSTLDVGEMAAYFRIDKDIRITNIALDGTQGNGISNWEEYNVSNISSNIDLPSSSSQVTYNVEITNLGNIEAGIFEITGLPENLKYTLNNYNLKEELCDSIDNTMCKLGSRSYVNITISYKNNSSYNSSNTNYNINLVFDFQRFYSISYVNIDDTNLPTRSIGRDTLEFNLNTPYPDKVHITGNDLGSYNKTTGLIRLVEIDDDVTISQTTESYFVAYDGVDGSLFNKFDMTNITSFSRNTILSSSEIQTMINNSTVQKISTDASDPNYPSDFDVYGWIDNNNFYWWSEAQKVYFNPNTMGAFRLMTNLVTVDLNGTDTSLVKNFAHWFDKDAKLTTINGKINTSGLVLEYATSYDYGIDNDENGSSNKGLTYMFNDCKVLTAIDTSEIDTTNASDLKRMFGGCANIRELDVSHFNTTNAKSMYWMFRKMEKLTELNISNFDTSNVENMTGMFVNDLSLQKIYLGENFNTSKVKVFNHMFNGTNRLTTIYAYSDFNSTSHTSSYNMFINASNLVGSANTLDETRYDNAQVNISYARLAQNGIKGYLTPYSTTHTYNITYELDGADNPNPTTYTEETRTFTLLQPEKIGYTFLGWTGSNGDTPQLEVTIEQGSSGDRHYVAHFEQVHVDLFPKVFAISGSCNFNGSTTNITGSTCVNDLTGTNYTNGTYIDTNIKLYDSENLEKDYEIYFELSNYDPNIQETMPDGNKQNTIMNSKAENISGYPGAVIRKSGDVIEVKSFTKTAKANYRTVTSYKLVRINKKIYYSFNGGNLTLLNDNTTFNSPFDLNVWFGASKNSSGNAFRHFKGTLSNLYIKLGTYS